MREHLDAEKPVTPLCRLMRLKKNVRLIITNNNKVLYVEENSCHEHLPRSQFKVNLKSAFMALLIGVSDFIIYNSLISSSRL